MSRSTNFSLEAVEFPYVRTESTDGKSHYRPCLPVTFGYKGKEFPVGRALVDTGADVTLLPLEIAHVLEIELDDSKVIVIGSAGGSSFKAFPSRTKISYTIVKDGYRPIRWEGTAYFAEHEPVVLLGNEDCLEKFDLTFRGPERKLSVLPRFKA